ncbi:MAG: hypothetical protein DRJ35_00480 [Thermoprotei archaeon]|nr:MAG: hypothetical protein DRJ35_00480 [Thermoprotei archaeon]
MIVAFFEDRECVKDFHPISEYLNPVILQFYDGRIFEKWKKVLGAKFVGLLGRPDVAKSSSWYTGGIIDIVEEIDEEVFLVNSCANIFSSKIVELLENAAKHCGQILLFKGSRVLAVKLPRNIARSSLNIFNQLLEPELLTNYMGFVDAIPVNVENTFISPKIFIENLLYREKTIISEDSIIEDNVILKGSVFVGPGVHIKSGSIVENSVLERDSVIEGTIRQAYISANSLIQGYVEKALLGLSTIMYPYSVVKGCCPVTGIFTRMLPGVLVEGNARIEHGCELHGIFRDCIVEKLKGFYNNKSVQLKDVFSGYRSYLYSCWKRLPSRYEEILLNKH